VGVLSLLNHTIDLVTGVPHTSVFLCEESVRFRPMTFLLSGLSALVLMLSVASPLYAQGPPDAPPRIDDHFWRKRVVYQIDLHEKINRPLLFNSNNQLYSKEEYQSSGKIPGGMVQGLIRGLRDAQYLGIWPDTAGLPMTYEDFQRQMAELNGVETATSQAAGSASAEDDPGGFGEDTFGGGFDDLGGEFGFEEDDTPDMSAAGGLPQTLDDVPERELYQGLEQQIHLVTDLVFDKNRSLRYFDLQFVKLMWKDPLGETYTRPVIVFDYDDIEPFLDRVEWRSPKNEAASRSVNDILTLRLFHGIIVEIENHPPLMSLEQIKDRRLEYLQFEHNLWEY